MDTTCQVRVGDCGRLVLPAPVRERLGLTVGTELTLMGTPGGIALFTREQLRDRVRSDLSGLDLIGELVAERRREASRDDGEDRP